MSLLADGWHMGTHAAALGITWFAYRYARRHAASAHYTFGTGKVGALGGFASAIGLLVIAALVLIESGVRLARPVAIDFVQAIAVAGVGLAVNLASLLMLRGAGHHAGAHDGHTHPEDPRLGARAHGDLHRDHNLGAAYFHVLADALTSVLAIGALSAGALVGLGWLDPAIGVVGGLIIAHWSIGLVRDTSRVLLDAEIAPGEREAIRRLIESDADNRVTDLHLWRVGPRHLAAIVSIVTDDPREPGHYKALLTPRSDLVHVTVEVHRCVGGPCRPGEARE
jgi:cation diffusion facilitator family transporter